MAMTVMVTRDVAARFRGFLTSCMLEIAPGVYTAPRMSRAVRERVWTVVSGWHQEMGDQGSIVMTWPDPSLPGGQAVTSIGIPATEVVEVDGIYLAHKELPENPPSETSLSHHVTPN